MNIGMLYYKIGCSWMPFLSFLGGIKEEKEHVGLREAVHKLCPQNLTIN